MSNKYFRWLGGKPIFDFCNTVLIHPESTLELLDNEDDLQRWFSYLGYDSLEITPEVLREMIQLRGRLRDCFFRVMTDQEAGIEQLNQLLAAYPTRLRIQNRRSRYRIRYFSEETPRDIILGELAKLFETAQPSRIKQCHNVRCSHLFYDTSKANLRKWCDMNSCGNQMKARRFAARQQ